MHFLGAETPTQRTNPFRFSAHFLAKAYGREERW